MRHLMKVIRGKCTCSCGTISGRGCVNGWHCHGPNCNI